MFSLCVVDVFGYTNCYCVNFNVMHSIRLIKVKYLFKAFPHTQTKKIVVTCSFGLRNLAIQVTRVPLIKKFDNNLPSNGLQLFFGWLGSPQGHALALRVPKLLCSGERNHATIFVLMRCKRKSSYFNYLVLLVYTGIWPPGVHPWLCWTLCHWDYI